MWILFFDIKSGTLQPTLCRENQHSGAGVGWGGGRLWPPNEDFIALFSSTPIFNSIIGKDRVAILLTQSNGQAPPRRIYTAKRLWETYTPACQKKKRKKKENRTFWAAIPTFTLKHHKKQTKVNVKSFLTQKKMSHVFVKLG